MQKLTEKLFIENFYLETDKSLKANHETLNGGLTIFNLEMLNFGLVTHRTGCLTFASLLRLFV